MFLFYPQQTVAEENIEIVEQIVELTIEQKIRQTFPEQPDLMVEIAKAESSLNPLAYNPEYHNGCQGSRGLFQIACVNYEGDYDELFDVDINLSMARKLYDTNRSVYHWGVCHNGTVDCGIDTI